MSTSYNLDNLIPQEEGQYFERKSLWHGPPHAKKVRERREVRDEIAVCVAAFANADGGVLVMGVEDDGTPTGHGYPDEAVADFLAVPERRLQPTLPCGERVKHGDLELLVYSVEPSAHAVMVTGDGFPYRSHDNVMLLRQDQIEALKHRGFVESAETRPAETGRVDLLDTELVKDAARCAGFVDESVESYLVRRRLADLQGSALVLRSGALWLFAKATADVDHPNTGVRIFCVDGTDRRTGASHNVEEFPRIEGNLLVVLRQAYEKIVGLIRKSARLHDLFFREMPEYPTFAWQEALVNALAHRDYSILGSCVEVWMFDDRMEIRSPGALLPEVSLEDLLERKGMHASRNPRIARILSDMGIMREQGEGIPRMFEEMEDSWLPAPGFQMDHDQFRVTLQNTPIFTGIDREWTKYVQGLRLATEQKRALVGFARSEFANSDYKNLNHVDRDRAYRDIQELVADGLLLQQGDGKGTRYCVNMEHRPATESLDPLARLRRKMEGSGYITNEDYRAAFGVDRHAATKALGNWSLDGALVREGERRGARYKPGPNWPPVS